MGAEMATAHRWWPVVPGPVVEGGVVLDRAVCFPVEGGEDGSAGSQQRLARDVGPCALKLLRKPFGIGMLACEWCIVAHAWQVGMGFH